MANYLITADKLIEQGQFAEAIKDISKHLKSHPDDVQAFYLQGVAYRRLLKFRESIAAFDAALRLTKNDANLLSERGVTRFHARDTQGAIDDLEAARKLQPDNPYRYSSLAYIHDKAGNSQEAMEMYRKALILDPEDDISLNNLGLIEERMGHLSRAKKNFSQADSLHEKRNKQRGSQAPGYEEKSEDNRPERVAAKELPADQVVKLPEIKPAAKNKKNSQVISASSQNKTLSQVYFKLLGEMFTSPQRRSEVWNFFKNRRMSS